MTSSSYIPVTQPNFLSKFSKVSPTSLEWSKIEYHLQLTLGSTCSIVKNLWSIASGNNSYNFEKSNKGMLTLDCWLETNILDENNRLEKVCLKGFDFPVGGLMFPTGQIKLGDSQFGKNKVYEFLLLRIAVGKSYCIPASNTNKDKYKLPYGFDSIYLFNEDTNDVENAFKNDYILFDNAQVLPSYIVHFELDPKKEEAITPPLCELCKETKANVYCRADDICLCYDCDEEHHAKGGKLVNRHQRVPVHEKPKTFGECSQHGESKLELFCNVCHVAICVYCKINGSHSVGEPANHPVVKITDAYAKAIAESREVDPLLEKRKSQLSDLLSQIDFKIKEINKNSSFIEERIYQILQEALIMLQEETHKKMTYLIGDQLELKRQYEQIQWLESFLKYQQEILHPSDYLNNWGRHLVLRNEILSLSNIPNMTNVQADIRLDGKLSVFSDSNNRKKHEENSYFSPEKSSVFEGDTLNKFCKYCLINYFHRSQMSNSRLRTNMFNKHNVSEKNSRIIRSGHPKGGTFLASQNSDKSPVFNNKESVDLFPPQELIKTTSLRPEPNMNTLSLAKKPSLRPSNTNNMDLSQDYMSSPDKTSPEKPNSSMTDSRYSATNKIFKPAINKYQAHLIEENEDEEEIDQVEENFGGPVKKQGFYGGDGPFETPNIVSYNMSSDAKDKQNSLKNRNLDRKLPLVLQKVFRGSNIVTSEKEIANLYLNLPGFLQYDTELVFSLQKDKNFDNLEKNLASWNKAPVVVLLYFAGERFGGFASDTWELSKTRNFGDVKSCFLFNLKKDIKIPCMKNTNTCLFSNGNGAFGFGGTDLVFTNDFERCSSELENCYTFNLQGRPEECKTLLAGAMTFKPENVEFWVLTQMRSSMDF